MVTLTALKWIGVSPTAGSLVEATTVRAVAGAGGGVCPMAGTANAAAQTRRLPIAMDRMSLSLNEFITVPSDHASLRASPRLDLVARHRRDGGADHLRGCVAHAAPAAPPLRGDRMGHHPRAGALRRPAALPHLRHSETGACQDCDASRHWRFRLRRGRCLAAAARRRNGSRAVRPVPLDAKS